MASTRRKTLEEFIADAKKVHGDDYDYSMVNNYVNNRTAVSIRCNNCGLVFPQTPHAHLAGQGCPDCGIKRNALLRTGKPNILNRKKVFGIGINDYELPVVKNGKTLESYTRWHNVLQRCFGDKWKEKKPTYKDCTICEEWLHFSNFKKWYDENGKEGYHVDKDILVKGNKVYSPETCCCVPPRINAILINRTNDRGNYPIGVCKKGEHFTGSVSVGNGKLIYTGWYDTPQEAFLAYKAMKEKLIKEVAQEYYNKGEITERVYDALMRYEVEITD